MWATSRHDQHDRDLLSLTRLGDLPELRSGTCCLTPLASGRRFVLCRRRLSGYFREDFPFSRKPVLLGMAMHAPSRIPEFVCALANALLQRKLHVSSSHQIDCDLLDKQGE
jgi:hypothetical protein